MFDFNFLRPSKSDYSIPSAPNLVPEKKESKSGYTVGIDSNGSTTLTLIDGLSSITMTMTEHGVYQLISLLEATLPRPESE